MFKDMPYVPCAKLPSMLLANKHVVWTPSIISKRCQCENN